MRDAVSALFRYSFRALYHYQPSFVMDACWSSASLQLGPCKDLFNSSICNTFARNNTKKNVLSAFFVFEVPLEEATDMSKVVLL